MKYTFLFYKDNQHVRTVERECEDNVEACEWGTFHAAFNSYNHVSVGCAGEATVIYPVSDEMADLVNINTLPSFSDADFNHIAGLVRRLHSLQSLRSMKPATAKKQHISVVTDYLDVINNHNCAKESQWLAALERNRLTKLDAEIEHVTDEINSSLPRLGRLGSVYDFGDVALVYTGKNVCHTISRDKEDNHEQD